MCLRVICSTSLDFYVVKVFLLFSICLLLFVKSILTDIKVILSFWITWRCPVKTWQFSLKHQNFILEITTTNFNVIKVVKYETPKCIPTNTNECTPSIFGSHKRFVSLTDSRRFPCLNYSLNEISDFLSSTPDKIVQGPLYVPPFKKHRSEYGSE